MRPLQILLLATCLLIITGCTSLKGTFENGVYVSPDSEFFVEAPNLIALNVQDGRVGDSKYFVDFVIGKYYWTGGGYSAVWYKLDKPFESDLEFLDQTKTFLPSYVNGTVGEGVGLFKVSEEREIEVRGKKAYQVVATGSKDRIPAYFVATSINFGDRAAIGQVLIEFEKGIPWDEYNKFIDSISKQ